jgi:galactokinase
MTSADLFQNYFHHKPQITAAAHGRVNLIGEHTDYNGGYVLPTLIPQQLSVSISLRDDHQIHGTSKEYGERQVDLNSTKDNSWLDFVRGAIHFFQLEGVKIQGLNIAVTSDIPSGAGLSSSAALEIAILRALSSLFNITIPSTQLALMGQKIEHEFVGTQCGIMDQMACANTKLGEVLFLDCESLQTQIIPQFPEHRFLVIHSGSSRKLSEGNYNQRKSETSQAAQFLDIPSLRHATLDLVNTINNDVILRRARHIVSENSRVLQSLECFKKNDPETFGELMYQSHQSMAEDYEISSAELNVLVDAAKDAGALGARLTGAGFGGCVVVLTPNDKSEKVAGFIANQCPNSYLVTVI